MSEVKLEMVAPVRFKVTEVYLTRLLGTAPADKETYTNFIASKKAEAEEKKRKFGERHGTPVTPNVGTAEEEAETINEEGGVTCFHNDLGQETESGEKGKGLFLYDYQVAGFYKESAETLSPLHGIPMVRSKLDNMMMVSPRRIYITDADGKPLDKPDGKLERPLRAMTMQGPRVSLACSEIVNPGRRIEYTIDFLPFIKTGKGKEGKLVDLDKLVRLLVQLGERKGRGQWRTGGNGKFKGTVEPLKE
jgi:hypothetical protein